MGMAQITFDEMGGKKVYADQIALAGGASQTIPCGFEAKKIAMHISGTSFTAVGGELYYDKDQTGSTVYVSGTAQTVGSHFIDSIGATSFVLYNPAGETRYLSFFATE